MKNALLTMAVAAACFSYGRQAEKTSGDIVRRPTRTTWRPLDPAIGYDWQNWSMIKKPVRRPDGLSSRHHRVGERPGGELRHFRGQQGLHAFCCTKG